MTGERRAANDWQGTNQVLYIELAANSIVLPGDAPRYRLVSAYRTTFNVLSSPALSPVAVNRTRSEIVTCAAPPKLT